MVSGAIAKLVTNPKESGVHSPAMNATSRRNPADRDRGVARLRLLTIGTSVASVVAVGAFGAVAALSYSGGSNDVTTAAVTTTTTTKTSGAATSDSSTSTSTSTSLQATATPTPTQTTTTTTGTAHATSGGS